MKKLTRISAIIGVILLLSIYVITFVSSLVDSPFAHSLFKASLFSTFAIPVFIYGMMLVYRLIKEQNDKFDINESEEDKDN
ncbi:MAG TPA: hypothetical protein GX705_03565 [Clostridiales bacterium]|nr:hypothetical protein [Clostridiales bacterium]